MVTDENTIKKNFVDFINKYGAKPKEWYTGIATDPKKRLDDHKVTNGYTFDNAGSEEAARRIEKYMVETVGTQGGGGGGDKSSTWIYCYKITSSTIENA